MKKSGTVNSENSLWRTMTFNDNSSHSLVDDNETIQSQLNSYKEMFGIMVENAPVSMFIIENGSLTYVNKHFCNVLGYEEDDFVSGRVGIEQLIHPENVDLVQENMAKKLEGKVDHTSYRLKAINKEGNLIYVEISSSRVVISGKIAVLGTLVDVTEEVIAQIKLMDHKERLQSLFYNNPDAIFTTDLEGNFTAANPGCEVLSGYSISDLLEMSFTPLIISEDLPIAINYFEQATKGFTNNYDITITGKDGNIIHLNVTNFPMKIDGEIVGAYGIAKDITEKVEYSKQIEDLAFYDPLTNLPNRRLFQDRLQQVVEYSKENNSLSAVLFLDLDRFKFINDSLGHHLGDEFLIRVSERIKNNLRKTDTIARFAGDEFAILVPKSTKDEVIKLAERINQALVEPFNIKGHSVSVSASIGIAFSLGLEETAVDLVKKADTAMYYTKKFGKNNYTIYSEELDQNTSYKLKIEKDLKSAIRNNEFSLYYQPIIDLKTGDISGMEALIRWNHPDLGLLSPDQFIPISEESGQIVSLGKWVLQTACSQNKKWQDSGQLPFKISVNISTIQLKHQNFVETVAKILRQTGLESRWLELEVTESILLEDTEHLKESLLKLKELGVSISIDDFGTGYTSLSYLRQFSFDRLKIDRSFINDINNDLNGKAITSTIISLAHKLNMGVIAEGIEDGIQLAYLKEEMCEEGQGYYFSRPIPAEQHKFPIVYKSLVNP